MYCQNCGTEIPEGGGFCSECGKPVNVPVQQTASYDSADLESDKQDKSPKGSVNKQAIKKSAVFLAKWLGVCVAILLALSVVAVIVGCIAGTPSSLSYRACALVAVALVAAVPYAIAVIVLTVVGVSRRTRVSNAIRKVKDKIPAVFKGCVAAAVVLLVALFYLTPCRHSEWTPATCTAPKTCSACGETEGEALGHNPGDWTETEYDAVHTVRELSQSCTRCGEVLDTKEEGIDSFVLDGKFVISPDTYSDVFEARLRNLKDSDYELQEKTEYSLTTYSINNAKGKMVGQLSFQKNGENLDSLLMYTKPLNYGVVILVDANQSNSSDVMSRCLLAMIEASDPSLGHKELESVYTETQEVGSSNKNGITYSKQKNGSYYLLEATLDQLQKQANVDLGTPKGAEAVNADLDLVRERLLLVGKTADEVKSKVSINDETSDGLRENVEFLGLQGSFFYTIDRDSKNVSNLFFKWELSDYEQDMNYVVSSLSSYFGSDYERDDISKYNKGNDCFSFNWWKTTGDNWSVYLVLTDEDSDGEGGSIQFTQLKKQ